ncbi:hypothetical protein EVAR_47904_1 [Eumeta japonica]|uniref:Uncharacterized protein n=1 Tax=Eumeta variegata TaxID=151549 RepID=A0A4C1Y7S5_EUMVA|nr:hypothetical protein EVAR_47904_1 [Eumeta japonica]
MYTHVKLPSTALPYASFPSSRMAITDFNSIEILFIHPRGMERTAPYVWKIHGACVGLAMSFSLSRAAIVQMRFFRFEVQVRRPRSAYANEDEQWPFSWHTMHITEQIVERIRGNARNSALSYLLTKA